MQRTVILLAIVTCLRATVAVWESCADAGGPEYPGYHCGHGERKATYLGIYMNSGIKTVSRSIGSLETGVKALIQQSVIFKKLQADVAYHHFDGSISLKIKPEDLHKFKVGETFVEIPPGCALIVLQVQTECAVNNGATDIPRELMLYSGPIIVGTVNFNECDDKELCALKVDEKRDTIKNFESHSKLGLARGLFLSYQ